MNKLKLWKIESLVEEGFLDDRKERKLAEPIFALQDLTQKIKENYVGGISKFHPNFFLVEKFDFMQSNTVVFENEEDDDRSGEGGTKFFGLLKQQMIFKNGVPIYLVDNHNKALFSFLEVTKNIGEQIDIVHIDAHRDDAIFQHPYPEKITWENIGWCLDKTRVSDYLDLAEKSGLVRNIFNMTQSNEFENFTVPKCPYILNLDIDIFGPEGDAVGVELKIQTIIKAWSGATAILIATSPGYISSNDAEEIIKIFMKGKK